MNAAELVMVLAEPGQPNGYRPEHYHDMDTAFENTGQYYRTGTDPGHRNVRGIINRCFPGLSFQQAMHKVWITESVLCSVKSDTLGRITAPCERYAVETYLLPQLRLFPNAIVAAMGGKSRKQTSAFWLIGRCCVRSSLPAWMQLSSNQGFVGPID